MPDSTVKAKKEKTEMDQYLDKCLSMILHHDEVQQISEIIKKILKEKPIK